MDLVQRLYQGDIRALSRLISRIEDRQEGFRTVLGELYKRAGHALRIGVTGPPGAGKSTLVNCLAHHYLDRDKRVGIIAVDPTSPFTGGALLGDRVRMHEFPTGGQVYFRSMASRGASGGLSEATNNVTVALDAFGFDTTLIETVGVGQIELDIIDACDVVVVAVVPESGDAVQTMKAGLMEIADVMVVNKSDRPGAESVVAELRQALRLRKAGPDQWKVPVVGTEATNGKGIDKLTEHIDKFVEHQKQTGAFDIHRRRRVRRMILNILSARFRKEFLARLSGQIDFDAIIDDIHQGRSDPYLKADELFERFASR
ncbi:MAG: methylmalonyl Co-A mutase-associated GTPase MeaB [bacterium]